MLIKSILVFSSLLTFIYAIRHDRFTGKEVSSILLEKYTANNTLRACTIDIKKCDAKERRRIDGSCNNLKHPARGTITVPHMRVLPAAYYNGRYPRKAASGRDLRLPREVRTKLLGEVESVNIKLSALVPTYAVFMFGEIGSTHDIRQFVVTKPDCCGARKGEYLCTPNIIPEDDPVHRFSGIRCMNLTRPIDFQYLGCTNDSTPSPIEESTSVYDLSPIYYAREVEGMPNRLFEGGLLITEEENGIIWPRNGNLGCFANSPGQRCFRDYSNSLLSIQLFSLWFVRHHNYIANALSKLNPCWNDEKLFLVARDINIAFSQQIHIYELLATIVGKQNLVDSGVAGNDAGFRDIYDENMYPATTLEHSFSMRWFHIMQNGPQKMYDTKGNYLRDYPSVNSTFRAGFIGEKNNLVEVTQGFFRTEANKPSRGVHPDLANMGLPNIQDSVDVPTSDLHKNRLFGLRPYIDYVKHFFGLNISCFEDLCQLIDRHKILMLKRVYDNVQDIDLMAGMWTERKMEGGHIPATLAAILKDSILNNIKGDRHWYERRDRPYAFTSEQLKEVRKATLALLMCTVADGMSVIQKDVFLNISPKNPLVGCEKIPKMDLSKWFDQTCSTSSTAV